MANYFVRSTDGSDSDNGTTWALAKATLAGAFAVAAAGDTVYVSQVHAETLAGTITLASGGTAASPIRVLCSNDSAEPPTALATTATITATGNNDISLRGIAYYYGINFKAGNSNGATNVNVGFTQDTYFRFEACQLELGSTGSGRITFGINTATVPAFYVELVNTKLKFSASGQEVRVQGPLRWTNTASAIAGTAPSTLFVNISNTNAATIRVSGVDLSAVTGSLVDVAHITFNEYTFANCKLGSGVAIPTGTNVGQGGTKVELVNCDSGNTNYRYRRHRYEGDVYSESTIVRSGGASDGTTTISRKLVTSANSKFYSPLESAPIFFWNETTGSSVTVTVPVVTDGVTLTDAEAWIEVEYLGTSGFPLTTAASDRAADVLATPANQTTDSSTWTTTGLSSPIKQNLSVSFTPQVKGLMAARVMLAKASTTMYFDPLAQVT